jgi:hypothetical protein
VGLTNISAIRGEMARIYRLAINGKLPTDELTRLTFALKAIGEAVEAERASPDVSQLAPIEFNVFSVPSGTQIAEDGRSFIWPDGVPCAAPPFEPYRGTPALDMLPPPMIDTTPLEVHEAPDDPKIVRLRLREDDTGSGAA